MPFRILLGNDWNELGLVSARVNLWRDNLRFCPHSALSAIGFLAIKAVADHKYKYLVYGRVVNHLLHEVVFILTGSKVPLIKHGVYPIVN